MVVKIYTEPQAFLDHASAFLVRNEAANCIPLGIAADLAGNPRPDDPPPFFATAEQAGLVVAACLRTPPHPLSLSLVSPAHQDAVLATLADVVLLHYPDVPAVSGPKQVVERFAELVTQRSGRAAQIRMSLRIYQLTQVTPPQGVPGMLRRAHADDAEQIATWLGAFSQEAEGVPENIPQTVAAERWVSAPNRAMYLWEVAGQTVSMAGVSGPTPHGIRIGAVYTPPLHRGHGYASAVVARASQIQLASGKQFCCLFTDLSNPVSNSIYQRIGYTPVCDAIEVEFH